MGFISNITTPDDLSYDIAAKYGRGVVRAIMDSTSTKTAFVATADGISELYDGLIITLKNTVAESASGCTLNLNNLGAKRIWQSQANSYCTTQWALNAEYIFVYDATNSRWVLNQGYNTNTNTQVRAYRQTYDNDYPLLASRTPGASIGTPGTESTQTAVYGMIPDDAAKQPTIRPSTGELKATIVSATTFNGDLNGDASTVNGHTVAKDVPSNAIFTDTNTKTRQYLSTTNSNRPLLLAYATNTDTSQYTTDYTVKSNDIYANPSTGAITANNFNGRLNGHQHAWISISGGEATGSNEIEISDDWNAIEFYILVRLGNQYQIYVPIQIPIIAISGTNSEHQILRSGWRQDASNGGEISIDIWHVAPIFKVKLTTAMLNSSNVTSTSTTKVYLKI